MLAIPNPSQGGQDIASSIGNLVGFRAAYFFTQNAPSSFIDCQKKKENVRANIFLLHMKSKKNEFFVPFVLQTCT